MRTDICPRCATRLEWAKDYESRTQARNAGALGDTRTHTSEDCIKRLRGVLDLVIQASGASA